MSAEPRQLKRKAARRPESRTVTVRVAAGDFEGWEATARTDFPAKYLEKLESGRIGLVLEVMDLIIIDHNMPDTDGNIAETMGDVDPYHGMIAVATLIGDAISKLPNR